MVPIKIKQIDYVSNSLCVTIYYTLINLWIYCMEWHTIQKASQCNGHYIGAITGTDTHNIIVVQTLALKVLCNANCPIKRLSVCYTFAINVIDLLKNKIKLVLLQITQIHISLN